jgi:hypothetical protein
MKISVRIQLIILLVLSVGLNINTIFNEYALDDIVVLVENKFVQKGISGIPEIVSTDLMQGYSSKENILEQKRYRPLSIVLFAVEYQFFGANPLVSHLINVIIFALLVYFLYRLLSRHFFKDHHPYLTFLTCLLFVVHPIHTEVIANVKSRDELLTFLFLILSLTCFLNDDKSEKKLNFVLSGMFFFLALLTRESSVTFMAIFPLSLIYFKGVDWKVALKRSVGLVGVFFLYMVIRYSIIGLSKPVVTDVLNAPYLLATPIQAFATKVFVILKYILILIFPHPLSSDYSYSQIPYIGPASYQFISAVVILLVLFFVAIRQYKSRSLFSFSVLYFFVTISLMANFVVDIGTPFSERLLFQASLAYCIVIASVILFISRRSSAMAGALLVVLIFFYSAKTVSRNREWKNNETLYMADVKSAPNSVRTTLFALEVYRAKARAEQDPLLRKTYFDAARDYGKRSLEIYPDFSITLLNMGFVYFYQNDLDSAAYCWKRGYELDRSDTEAVKCVEVLGDIFYKKGNGSSDAGEVQKAIRFYRKSVDLNPDGIEAWYNLGGCYFSIGDSALAEEAWTHVRHLDPSRAINKKDFILE